MAENTHRLSLLAKGLIGVSIVGAFLLGHAGVATTTLASAVASSSANAFAADGSPEPQRSSVPMHPLVSVRANCAVVGVPGHEVRALVQLKTIEAPAAGDQETRRILWGIGRKHDDDDTYDIRCSLKPGAECTVLLIRLQDLNLSRLDDNTISNYPGFRVTSYDRKVIKLAQSPGPYGGAGNLHTITIDLVAKHVSLRQVTDYPGPPRSLLDFRAEGDCTENAQPK